MAISDKMKQEIHEAAHKQWRIHGLQTPIAIAKTIIAALEIYDAAELERQNEIVGKATLQVVLLRSENVELKEQISQLRQMLDE